MSDIILTPTGPIPPPAARGNRGTVFVPFVTTGSSPNTICFDNPAALAFYHLLITDERQQRPGLTCCPSLVLAARQRAAGLAAGDPWGHVDASGRTPNEYARGASCHLPAFYPEKANNIESLVAGSPDVQTVFTALANSPSHAAHLFGLNDFFRSQPKVGIAMMAGGFYGWYWVILIAECGATSGE